MCWDRAQRSPSAVGKPTRDGTLLTRPTASLPLLPCQTPQAAKIALALAKGVHYTVDEKQRNVLLTEEGYEAAEDVLQVR